MVNKMTDINSISSKITCVAIRVRQGGRIGEVELRDYECDGKHALHMACRAQTHQGTVVGAEIYANIWVTGRIVEYTDRRPSLGLKHEADGGKDNDQHHQDGVDPREPRQ